MKVACRKMPLLEGVVVAVEVVDEDVADVAKEAEVGASLSVNSLQLRVVECLKMTILKAVVRVDHVMKKTMMMNRTMTKPVMRMRRWTRAKKVYAEDVVSLSRKVAAQSKKRVKAMTTPRQSLAGEGSQVRDAKLRRAKRM